MPKKKGVHIEDGYEIFNEAGTDNAKKD